MGNAAAIFLQGIDPVGVPYLATSDPLVREVWVAIGMRANREMERH